MDLKEQIESVNQQVEHHFLNLTHEQLNWKHEASKWSIAQCLDHLIVSNTTYFPIFDQLINGKYELSFLQRMNPFKKFLGPMMIRSLGPESNKQFVSPKIFEPSFSNIRESIVMDFIFHQDVLKKYFLQLQKPEILRSVIASPVSKMITYSVADALQIITGHEQRHINQAIQVLNHFNFPKS
jgi:hypothetical protein